MDKTKVLKKAASALRQSFHYAKNKESYFSNRFDFVMNKENKEIDVFNAEKGNDTFYWADFCINVALAHGLSYYFHIDTYGTKKLTCHIY